MVKALVLRGAGVGALAGLLAFVFARIFAEPVIQAAIDYESARDDAKNALAVAAGQAPETADPEIFSRAVQGNIGIGVGMVFFGVAIGLLYATAYSMAYGRTGEIRPRQLALLVAAGGFLTFFLVPFVKYPANPPSIGNPDTIGPRSGLYLVMVVTSVVVLLLAVWLGQRLQARLGTWNAALLAGLAFVVVTGVVMALLPALGELSANAQTTPAGVFTETPQPLTTATGAIAFPGFDPDLLYRFRLYSVIAQVILWGALGLGFAPLADRVFGAHGRPSQKDMATIS
ncbi:CbtA family protein [Pseudonocardia endophytica]|uniref:Putative cobalt transporter subunit CbtA n=1 Tax=Pseudonocardia endophytica TaxID=401976 RepID=A0A4R1HSN5_PSEEN|nr:CbtA family protein [Pseudonocardia endophytica]TCK25664.1 putative cobalt transporter subunit CbtA [Pseudonocardia endophytica]